MGINGLKAQTAVSILLQRVLNNPNRGIRVLSSETLGHFLNKKKNVYAFEP